MCRKKTAMSIGIIELRAESAVNLQSVPLGCRPRGGAEARAEKKRRCRLDSLNYVLKVQ
jgi:hypothetical protein